MAFEQDWAFLRAALPDLQDYLLSNELYWPLWLTSHTPGSLQTPRLSIGSLLLSQKRLFCKGQTAELARLGQEIQQVRADWRSNWSRKASREFTSRLNLWRQYIQELSGDQRAAGYASEVRQRAILELLKAERLEGISPAEQELLNTTDSMLRGLTQSGSFVWEPEIEPGFPQDDFWFLYRFLG